MSLNRNNPTLLLTFCLLAASAPAFSQATTSAADPKSVPVIDGGLGPCSAEFTVTDSEGAPVYDAKIRVHIAYRFMSLHKLDLEIGTNADGQRPRHRPPRPNQARPLLPRLPRGPHGRDIRRSGKYL